MKSSSKLLKTEAIFGKVVDISDLRTYKTQDKVEKKFFYLAVADKTDSITVMVYGEERFKHFKKRSCYSFKNVIVDGNTIKVTRLTTVLKIKAFKVPSKVEKDAQTLRKQKPVSPTRKTPVKVKGVSFLQRHNRSVKVLSRNDKGSETFTEILFSGLITIRAKLRIIQRCF